MDLTERQGRAAGPPAGWAGRLARHPLTFVAALVAIYGYRREDYPDFALLTRDPFVTHPLMARQFLHSSPLTPLIGWPLTSAFGPHASYAIVCALGFALLLAAAGLYLRGVKADRRRTIVLVVFSTPLLLVLSRWLGKGDPYLLGFFLLGLASRGRPLRSGVAAALLVASHRELGLIMLAGDALVRWELRLPTVLGAASAVAAVALYHHALSQPPFSRVDLALAFFRLGFAGWERLPGAHLLLAFTWFWMMLFLRRGAGDGARLAIAVALCFAVSVDGADFTRDFILCAFPVVIYVAEGVA